MRVVDASSLVFGVLLAGIVGGAVGFIAAQALGSAVSGLLVGGGTAAVVLVLSHRGALRRWRVARRSLPRASRRWLEKSVPLYAALGPDERLRFERDVQFFLDEHSFEGIDGVEVDDELRLAVAAGAAVMLHGRPGWELSGAGRSVLFYPGTFDDAYHGSDYADFDGMAHEQGPILLSVRAVRQSWADPGDGQNVVLHELAHLFDFQNQGADGVPSLMAPESEDAWRDLVRRETRRIRRRRSMLRRYAATAPSEFFAVAVEVFFERPAALRRRHGELYDALKNFFDLDPVGLGLGTEEAVPEEEWEQPETLRSTVERTGGDLTNPS